MIMERRRLRQQYWMPGAVLRGWDWRPCRDQLGELSEVLDGSCEVELITEATRAT